VNRTAPETWAFLSGRVAAMESRLIRNDVIQRMAAIEQFNDVFLAVSDTAYKDAFPIIEKLHEADSIITGVYSDRLAELARYSPQPEVVELFRIGDDFRSLKAFLKNKLAGLQLPVNGGRIPDAAWQRVLEDLKTDLPPFWYDATAIIRRECEAQPELAPQTIDLVLDSEQLARQVEIARIIGAPLIIEWASRRMIVRAIEVVWRAKTGGYDMARLRRLFLRGELDDPLLGGLAGLPLDQWAERLRPTFLGPIVDDVFAQSGTGQVTRFARRADDLLLELVKKAKSVPFGPERIFGYLCALRTEVHNLRLILAGKVNKINSRLLRERLREQYV